MDKQCGGGFFPGSALVSYDLQTWWNISDCLSQEGVFVTLWRILFARITCSQIHDSASVFLCAKKVMQCEAAMVINNENKLKLHGGHFTILEFSLNVLLLFTNQADRLFFIYILSYTLSRSTVPVTSLDILSNWSEWEAISKFDWYSMWIKISMSTIYGSLELT